MNGTPKDGCYACSLTQIGASVGCSQHGYGRQSQTKPTMGNKIRLVARPADAPCCIKLESEDGKKSMLVQTDWDWPGVAGNFGFVLRSVQKCKKCRLISEKLHNEVVQYCRHCEKNVGYVCDHEGTDGTVDCTCGVKASDFVSAAGTFIHEHDGAVCENPGYTLE